MLICYQRKKFTISFFDDEGNESGHLWKISEFYNDFPFLPTLNFDEIDSVNFDDERPLYIIVFFERLNKEAISGKTPDVHPFFQEIEKNKQTIVDKAKEYINVSEPGLPPARDLAKEFDELTAKLTKAENELLIVKNDVSVLKATLKVEEPSTK